MASPCRPLKQALSTSPLPISEFLYSEIFIFAIPISHITPQLKHMITPSNDTSSQFSLFISFHNSDSSSLELIANRSQGLSDRRNMHCLALFYKFLNSSTPKYLSSRFQYLISHHNLNTPSRLEMTLTIPLHHTSLYSSSFTIATARLSNSLPTELRDCQTLNTFKNRLIIHYTRN